MKKLLLGLGTVAAIAAPVASVIACGSDSVSELDQTKATYKTQIEKGLKNKEITQAQATKLEKDLAAGKDLAALTVVMTEAYKDGLKVVATTTGETPVVKTLTKLDKTNIAIAKIVKDNAAKDLTAPVAKLMTHSQTPAEVYPAMKTEGDLARVIEVVDSGFTVDMEIQSGQTDFKETYFIAKNDAATIDALKAKVAKGYHIDATAEKAITTSTPVAITGTKLSYIDATGQGVALVDIDTLKSFFNMKSAEFDLIKAELDKLA